MRQDLKIRRYGEKEVTGNGGRNWMPGQIWILLYKERRVIQAFEYRKNFSLESSNDYICKVKLKEKEPDQVILFR